MPQHRAARPARLIPRVAEGLLTVVELERRVLRTGTDRSRATIDVGDRGQARAEPDPWTAFDKRRRIPVLDDDDRVIDAVAATSSSAGSSISGTSYDVATELPLKPLPCWRCSRSWSRCRPRPRRAPPRLTSTASSKNVAFHESVTFAATVDLLVAGQQVATIPRGGSSSCSGRRAGPAVRPDVRPVGEPRRPRLVPRRGTAPRYRWAFGRCDADIRARSGCSTPSRFGGRSNPSGEGQSVTVELQHRGQVASTKRAPMDANGRIHATFSASQSGSYRGACVVGCIGSAPPGSPTLLSVTVQPDLAPADGIDANLLGVFDSTCRTTWSVNFDDVRLLGPRTP